MRVGCKSIYGSVIGMWIVSTDEFDPVMQEFDSERMAREGFKEFIEVRDISSSKYRIYLAEVKEFDGNPASFRRND